MHTHGIKCIRTRICIVYREEGGDTDTTTTTSSTPPSAGPYGRYTRRLLHYVCRPENNKEERGRTVALFERDERARARVAWQIEFIIAPCEGRVPSVMYSEEMREPYNSIDL